MPLLWLSVVFMLGIVAGSTFSLSWLVWLVLLLLAAGLGLLELRKPWAGWRQISPVPAAFLLAALAAGGMRFQLGIPVWTAADLAYYNDGETAQVRGWISAPPDSRDRIDLLQISAKEITLKTGDSFQPDPVKIDGKSVVMVRTGGSWRYGDEVLLTGQPVTPAENEDFSYRDYLARQGVYTSFAYPQIKRVGREQRWLPLKLVFGLRDRAYAFINRSLPQPEASLLAGILLGIETDIPANVEDAFQETGTTHIIAISGFNIAILAGLFVSLASRFFSPRWAPWVALAGISFYTVLVGAQPPVVRAAVMGGMGLLGRMLGRRQSGANSLAFTAAVMCLFNPQMPWDAGFQLSFAATLGLVLYADPLQTVCERLAARWFSEETARRLAAPVSEYFLFTLAAQVTTLPIIAYHFHRVSLSALLANPLILPPQPLVMICGGLAVLLGLVFPGLGRLAVGLTWPLLAYTIRMVELLARLPQGSLGLGQVSLWGVVGFYLLLLGFTLGWMKLPQPKQLRLRWTAASLALLLAAGVLWQPVLTAPDGRLHVVVLAVDEGPAILLQAPQGGSLLLNGGARASQLSDALGRRLPITHRSLDVLLLTPGSAASLEGLPETLQRFPVQQVFISGDLSQWQVGRRLVRQFTRNSLPVHDLASGEQIVLDGETFIHILAVTSRGTALLIEQGDFRMLIPGGVSLRTLQWQGADRISPVGAILLSAADLEIQSAEEWQQLQPDVVILSAPLIGIPHEPDWLDLKAHSWLELTSDGSQLWVQAGK
jgi:competence protein ComEC